MAQLSIDEARNLAKVFGEMDYKRALLLILFYKPHSAYDIMVSMGELPKSARIPRASLYRIVDELEKAGYLTSNRRPQKNRPNEMVNEYGLTLKGKLATWIYGYILLRDPKTPTGLIKRLKPQELVDGFESAPGWPLFLNSLKWHRDRGNDLSKVRFSIAEFMLSLLLSILEQPQQLNDSFIIEMVKNLKTIGIEVPPIEPNKLRELLENWKKTMDMLENTVLKLAGAKG